jgi:hypothetical protein
MLGESLGRLPVGERRRQVAEGRERRLVDGRERRQRVGVDDDAGQEGRLLEEAGLELELELELARRGWSEGSVCGGRASMAGPGVGSSCWRSRRWAAVRRGQPGAEGGSSKGPLPADRAWRGIQLLGRRRAGRPTSSSSSVLTKPSLRLRPFPSHVCPLRREFSSWQAKPSSALGGLPAQRSS